MISHLDPEQIRPRDRGLPRSWHRRDVQSSSITSYSLPANLISDAERLAHQLQQQRLGDEQVSQSQLEHPPLDVSELRARLERGHGFVLVSGLDVHRYDIDELRNVYLAFSSALGDLIPQHADGRLLTTVQDLGGDLSRQGTRYAHTNLQLGMHTDNAFMQSSPPDYAALLCVRSAHSGGSSHLLSAYTIYEDLYDQRPDLLSALTKPYPFDPHSHRHEGGGASTWVRPILEVSNGELVAHYIRYYLERGLAKSGEEIAPLDLEALNYFDALTKRSDRIWERILRPGDMLFWNNRWILHDRTRFYDCNDPAKKRHLERAWMWKRETLSNDGRSGGQRTALSHNESDS